MWRREVESGDGAMAESLRGGSLRIAPERVNFWAALKWLRLVHTPRESFVHLLCLAPLPQGTLVFRARLLDADILARDYPDLQAGGLMGEWCLEGAPDQSVPRVKFLRACDSAHHFLSILQNPRIHPDWLWPAYAALQGDTAESICANAEEMS